ncbi:UDP-GlcNAc:undecaprenyl-phosphate GlcNAc-1-phosphate transferase [Actinocorallia herbida]|uniref:UDP-GlcNAc:undecaprenyl-phosphate GlcNAc-1-phosphate transferase n=1 Tax=Actinocorallia herbida TaxID=58109 RepID=A0A3N1D8J3_9ACTN|nr:MraY family glycosyltransferase [Actinocorallia herbida]ROO89863.1 UDP-GlcNAc:undecaprenyl-phosphate GlcNAc-1-phosphate transferase [Actinocorallia herbida]
MREYLLVILTGIAVTYLLVSPVKSLAIAMGAQAAVRDRDVHKVPTPRIGGLAMFGGLLGALVMARALPHMTQVFIETKTANAVILSGALIVLLGIADDLWDIDALTKLAGQIAASGILIMNGVQLSALPRLDGGSLALSPVYGVPLTVFIVVATINAVNFIDGLDGLAAGVVGIAAFALFLLGYRLAEVVDIPLLIGPAMIAAVLVGICAGFLAHNFHPARIFMGDTGSMLIGLLLSAATIQLIALFDTAIAEKYLIFPLWLPLLLVPMVTVVPFADMLLAVWRRTNQGLSPFAPDKQHLHHRLLRLGHSHRRSVLIMYGWVGLVGACMVAMSFVPPDPPTWQALVLFITLCVAALGAALMVGVPRIIARRAFQAEVEAAAAGPGDRTRQHA